MYIEKGFLVSSDRGFWVGNLYKIGDLEENGKRKFNRFIFFIRFGDK